MTVIFDATKVGQVVKLDGPLIAGSIQRGKLLSLARGGGEASRLGDDFATFKASFTAVSLNEQANVQFQHTLGDAVYLNVFGDRIGNMKIMGIAVSSACGGRDDGEHGITKVLRYYRENKVSSRPDPLVVNLDSRTAYNAFLVGFQGAVFGEQQTIQRLFQFSMDLVLPPSQENQQ